MPETYHKNPKKAEINAVKKALKKARDYDTLPTNFFNFYKKKRIKEYPLLFELSGRYFNTESADIIKNMFAKHNMGLIITFDYKTRDLAATLKNSGINPEKKLHFVDCVSYNQGKGAPPVQNLFCINKPDDFENIFFYSIIQLERMNSNYSFIAILAPETLLNFTIYDEIGVFFKWYFEKLSKQQIPIIFLYKKTGDKILKNILRRLVDSYRVYGGN